MILFEKYNFKIYNTKQFSKRLPNDQQNIILV